MGEMQDARHSVRCGLKGQRSSGCTGRGAARHEGTVVFY